MSERESEFKSASSEDIPSDSKPKRKKTSRACNHCHKAHMTCDTSRPCKRCIQRGLEKSCEDAPRKRKKYLADVPNNALKPNHLKHTTTIDNSNIIGLNNDPGRFQATTFQHSATMPSNYGMGTGSDFLYSSSSYDQELPQPQLSQVQVQVQQVNQVPQQIIPQPSNGQVKSEHIQSNMPLPVPPQSSNAYPQNNQNSLQNVPPKSRRTNFLSSAADLEYSTLSSILQDNFMHVAHSATSNEGTPNSITLSPALSPHTLSTSASNNVNRKSANSPNDIHYLPKSASLQPISPYISGPSQTPSPNDKTQSRISVNASKIYDHPRYPKCDESINQYFLGPTDGDHISLYPDVITAINVMKSSDPAVYFERNSKSALSFTIGIVPEDSHYSKEEYESFFKEPEEIYAKVKKPFSYTPGYHSLIAYLRKRFPKPMLVKMAESMATYRPSFIACTNSLKEGDLIFMEQCFQRTLLTYDNFIRVSGTPTIVWRRTGEIAYVGNEFCVLTGWPKEELVGKQRKFIVELLDDKSVVEYFQLFSRIAFGDFLGATMTECTLLTPKSDVKIRTGCMWTLKRDVFGIPMMIIGNFLPII
ncbi:transcriptional regulator regulator of drug sensitivity [Scheffersomyces amazonensis]|uniref:transcriptional regulator regulator of drug sensitivity n=1 Tax=Scheffersomyces amazonensis TaxID=1078765 RepID=UPI00315C8B24